MAPGHSQAKGLRPVGSGQWTQASGLCGQWTLWPVDYGQGIGQWTMANGLASANLIDVACSVEHDQWNSISATLSVG